MITEFEIVMMQDLKDDIRSYFTKEAKYGRS